MKTFTITQLNGTEHTVSVDDKFVGYYETFEKACEARTQAESARAE